MMTKKRTMKRTPTNTTVLLTAWIVACGPSCLVPTLVQAQSTTRLEREFRVLGMMGKKKAFAQQNHQQLLGKKKRMAKSSRGHHTTAKLQAPPDESSPPWNQQDSQSPPWASSNTASTTPKCFDDALDATELGTLVLDSFWYEIYQTNCKPKEIEAVYDAYFRPDIIVNDAHGNVLADGLPAYKAYSIGNVLKKGSMSYICENEKLSFASTSTAVTEPGIYNDFVWRGNEMVTGVAPLIEQRWYFIELIGASGSFLYSGKGGKGSKSKGSSNQQTSWFYQYRGGGGKSSKYTEETSLHCHRPQIYGIVIFQ